MDPYAINAYDGRCIAEFDYKYTDIVRDAANARLSAESWEQIKKWIMEVEG